MFLIIIIQSEERRGRHTTATSQADLQQRGFNQRRRKTAGERKNNGKFEKPETRTDKEKGTDGAENGNQKRAGVRKNEEKDEREVYRGQAGR